MANKLRGESLEINGFARVGSFAVEDAEGNVGAMTVGALTSTDNVYISGSAVVSGTISANANSMLSVVLAGQGAVAIPFAGFFQIPVAGAAGAGLFTGSLPAASANPGGHLMLTDSAGVYPWKLTGPVAMISGSTTAAPGNKQSVNGTSLTLSAGASVGLWSDSKGWLVCALSGTVVVA